MLNDSLPYSEDEFPMYAHKIILEWEPLAPFFNPALVKIDTDVLFYVK